MRPTLRAPIRGTSKLNSSRRSSQAFFAQRHAAKYIVGSENMPSPLSSR